MKIKLGIIGFGGMGKWHAQNAPRAGVEIAAVCDIAEEKQKEAVEMGYKLYKTADELLADPEVNTVILTVPNYLHKDMCIKAAKAGKNVITEKPAALNVQELDEMEAACKEAGVFFTSHQNRRWDKDMLIVKKAYDEGLLGNIFTIESLVSCDIFLIYTIGTHLTPLVVISSEPYLCDIFKLSIFTDLLWVNMAMIIYNRHVLCIIMIKFFCRITC